MKEFVLIYRKNIEDGKMSPEQMQEALGKWMDWMAGLAARNQMVDRGSRLSLSEGRTLAPGNVVTDGPYTEIKEFINGYSVIRANTLDEAAEIAKGCPALQYNGTVEVRAIIAPDDNS